MTGSVRKLVLGGLALDKLGRTTSLSTPIYRRGKAENGVLKGDLILVASGDLSMGGRTNPDGSRSPSRITITTRQIRSATRSLRSPIRWLVTALAKQVAAAGIKEVTGDVIIDDRLFVPFNFRGEFDVRPIFVNDDVVDVMIEPAVWGNPAKVDWRPKSAAFGVKSSLAIASGRDWISNEAGMSNVHWLARLFWRSDWRIADWFRAAAD